MTATMTHLPLAALHMSKLNVRRHGPKDIASLAASIRAQGLLQPLIVRADGDGYEVAAGGRRLKALHQIAGDNEPIDPVPCVLLDGSDDAAAIEASLAENIERLPMDEMDQYSAFAALIKQGRSEDEIAQRFGVTTLIVRRRLGLARLHPDIHRLYRAGEIDADTLKLLTLASRDKQKAYVAALRDGSGEVPPRWQLKAWLLGGAEIATRAALFDEAAYTGDISGDLFGDARYFLDHEQFWRLQNEAIASLRDNLLAKGWSAVEIIGPGTAFQSWQYEDCPKAQGGHTVIEVEPNGTVTVHKGVLSRDDAKRRSKAERTSTGSATEPDSKPHDRPELSAPLANYIDLVRAALVKDALTAHPGTALKVLLALLVGGSSHLTAQRDPMQSASETAAARLASLPAHQRTLDAAARTQTALGLDAGAALPGGNATAQKNYAQVRDWSEADVIAALAVVTAQVLATGSRLIDVLGCDLAVTVRDEWQPDAAFLALVRDKEVTGALLADVIGKRAAASYLTDTGTAQKSVIMNALTGTARPKVDGWCPRWLAFPQKGYTKRPLTAGPRQEA